ncbi:type II secretion system F family protein [Vibrio cyclitrophicus]
MGVIPLKTVFIILGLVVSFIAAYYILKLFDTTKANISTKRIIGSTHEKVSLKEKILVFTSQVAFNREEVKANLVRAGIHNDFFSQVYYLLKILPVLFCIVTIGYMYFNGKIDMLYSFMAASISLLVFVIAPDIYIASRGKSNISHISSRLPFLLDLMNVCVHTGMTLEASLEYLSNELKMVDENLAFVVQKTSERAKIVGLDKALSEFYDLVPTTEAQSFVMTLTQSLKYGSSVGTVLASLASDIREINMLELEEKIGKMGAKMSVPMIAFIMIPIVILIAAPGIMRMLG